MNHKHSVFDTDTHFEISPITRAIKNTSAQKTTVIQYDHNSERFSFSMPRTVEGHDMMQCDRVEVHFINIDTVTKKQSEDIYTVDDMQHSPDDSGTVVFSWLVSGKATKYAGMLAFAIRFSCHDENDVEVYGWGTLAFTGISVSGGVRNDAAAIIEPYTDVLAQWEQRLFGAGDTAVQQIHNASAEQQNAIDAKGAAVLASIPAEYANLSALADDNFRRKAGAIMQTAAGESIVVSDASEYPLPALTIYGRSTQDGTPSPENPVEIKNVENTSVHFHTSNILPYPYKDTTKTENGITYTDNGDGTITANGTATGMSMFVLYYDEEKPVNVDSYYLSGCPSGGSLETYILRTSNITTSSATDYGDGVKSTVPAKYVFIRIFEGTFVENLTFKPMMNIGNEFMPFEKGVKNGCMIDRTLRGIPVASGGNYTDKNGQQWVCDEVDYERGVYVQRVQKIVLDGSQTLKNYYTDDNTDTYIGAMISGIPDTHPSYYYRSLSSFLVTGSATTSGYYPNTFLAKNGTLYMRIEIDGVSSIDTFKTWLAANPQEVQYVLSEPIETPLADVEITAFRALHTNKPNTTILNDSGAYMAAEYIADTKTYIDNKIAEMIGGETE